MAVSLPSSADVRKVREQAAKSAAERAELARTSLYAMLGAGEYAVTAVTKAVTDARSRAAEARGKTDLSQKLNGEELRKLLEDLRAQTEKVYGEFAQRGEQTWGHLLERPQLQQAVATLKAYTDKLDAHVDTLVDEAREAGEKALGTVSRQARTAGERAARTTQRFGAGAARTVAVATEETAKTVSSTGAEVAEAISTAGDELAKGAREAGEKAAERTAPATPGTAGEPGNGSEKPAARKPAARKAAPADKPADKG